MSDECQKKIADLQKYLPFLESTIKRLKSEEGKLRKNQITKLQSLFDFLKNSKEKKVKFDVLRKCEEVILKLRGKKAPSKVMYKYMCRNPPDDKYISGNRLNSDDVFSVDQQTLISNSPEKSVVPSEKVQNDRHFSVTDHNEYNDPSSSNNKTSSENQTLNYNFTPHFSGDIQYPLVSQNSNWKIRTNEINLTQEPNHKFNICGQNEVDFSLKLDPKPVPAPSFEMNFSLKLDPKPVPPPNFEAGFSLKLDPKPVPPPKLIDSQKINPKPVNQQNRKIQFFKKSTQCELDKPPLSNSDLKELLSSTISDNSAPLINKNLEKPVESNTRISTKVEDQQKVKSSPVIKPKQTTKVVERVIKEQDNLFGILLSTIDEQIMNKKDQKKNEKKDNKTDKNKKDTEVKQKKDETIVNENNKTNRELKCKSKQPKQNTKQKEYDKDSKYNEQESKNKDDKDKPRKSEEYDPKIKEIISKLQGSNNKEIKSTSNPKKVEKSTTIKNVDKSRRSSAKEEKQKDKTIDKTTVLPSLTENDLLRNQNQCRSNQIQTDFQKDEILIDSDQSCSNKDHKSVIDLCENEARDDLSCQKSFKDRGSHTNKHPKKRRNSLDRFSNKHKYRDRRKSLLKNNRKEQRFPILKKNYLRVSRFAEKRTARSKEKNEPNIEPKEEISSLDTIDAKPVKEYSIQNFRIPKICKSEIEDEFVEKKPEDKVEVEESKKKQIKEKDIKADPSTSKESAEISKSEKEEKIDMFNIFMKHIFGSGDSPFLLEYLDKRGKPVPQTKPKKVRRIIDSDSESEKDIAKETVNQQVEKIKIEETSLPKETEQDEKEEEKQRIYSSDLSPEKPLVTKVESPVKEKLITKSVRKSWKKRSPLELLLEDYRTVSKGSFVENDDQNKYKDFIINEQETVKNPEMNMKSAEQNETFKIEDKEEINKITPEKEFSPRRLRSTSRMSGKINISTDKYLNDENLTDEEEIKLKKRKPPQRRSRSSRKFAEKNDVTVIDEISSEKSKLQQRRSRSLSRKFAEKMDVSTVKSSEENCAHDKEKKKKDEISVIDKISSENELPRRRTKSLSAKFAEKMDFSIVKSSEENCADDKEKKKKDEMISVIDKISSEKSKLQQGRSRSLSRKFVEKMDFSTVKSSEENCADDKEKKKKDEMISVIDEISSENKIPRGRSKSLSCKFAEKMDVSTVKSSEENCADDKEKKKKDEMISVIDKISSENKIPRGRSKSLSRKFAEKMDVSTVQSSEKNCADDKEKKEKEEMISVIDKISSEKSKLQQGRSRSLSRKFAEKMDFSTVKSSEENCAHDKEKKKKDEMISVIDKISSENKIPRGRSKSLSRKFAEKMDFSIVKSSEENCADDKEKKKKDEMISVIDKTSSENKIPRGRSKSLSRKFAEKMDFSTVKSSEENCADDKEKKEKEEMISVIDKISSEKSKLQQGRSRSLSRKFVEKMDFSTVKSSEENCAHDKEKKKKDEMISVIDKISSENKIPRGRSKSLSCKFAEKMDVSTVKSSEKNCADDKEKKEKEEMISVIDEISSENKIPRGRSRSLSRKFAEKMDVSTVKSSEKNCADDKEKKEKDEMISVIDEISSEKSKLQQGRSRSLSRKFAEKMDFSTVKSSEKNCADDKEKKEKEEMISVIDEISSEKSKLQQGRSRSLSRKLVEKMECSTNRPSNEDNSTEEIILVINEITSEKSKFLQRRSRSTPRTFPEKVIIPTDRSSNEEKSTDNTKEKTEETIFAINEITSEKSKILQRRSRSTPRTFPEKLIIPTNRSSNEEKSTDNTKEKTEETIFAINEITSEKSKFLQRRSRSTPRTFPEKVIIPTDRSSNEEKSTDNTKEKTEETIFAINEITSEKSKFLQRRSRSTPRTFPEKVIIPTDKSSNEENPTDDTKKKTEETIFAINEITSENELPRGRLRSSSRCYIKKKYFYNDKSSEEDNTSDEKDKTEETMSVNNETTSKQNILPRGRLRSSSRLSEKNPTDKNLNEENKEKEKKKRERKPEKQIAESVKTETIKWLKNMKKKKRVKMRRTNWANGIIKPSRKKNKIEKNKLSLSLSTEINHISVTENFNENTEINTELPEILQSQILDDDEYALFKIDSKQDIYYFLDDRYSFDCKLCNYKGKSIVSHYRTRHPESENLISRLNPEEANKAQIESKMNNFDDITPFDEIENGKNRKTTFVCRFCNTLMTTEISTFVDHLSCHTGEYRYLCELCPFITSYKQNLCIHYYKSHPEIEKSVTYSQIWPSPPNFRIMFGYLCKACNFTQILRKNIQKHINISHLGQNIEIVKISLSKESVNLDDLIATRNIERDLIADKEIEEIYTSSQAETESNNTNKTNEDQQMHKNNKEMDITKLEHIFTDLNKKIEQKLTLNLSELTKTNDQEETINLGAIEVQIQNKKHNYICKVSNCNYTNLDKIKFIEHCANIHANITVLCEICAKENPNNYFTMISLFNHLFDVHINSTNLKILNSAQTEMPEPIIKKDLNPDMGFLQIKDIRTLTEEEEQKLQLTTNLPSIESYKKQPTTGNYVLCKTKKIFNEMLVHPKILDMYKCPIDICSYSCNSQKKFKRHMVSHKCQITVCVYCQMSFKPDKLIVHIKSVHAHCTFQCAFCFYRTISKQYLVYHQKNVHGQNCNTLIKFYQMKPRNKTEFVFDVPPRDVIIFPYTCNQDGCGQQFLIADDFMGHLHIYHKNNLICAICDDPTVYYVNAQNLIQHFVAHNIARFQCQYCICGTNDIEDMFMHYAKNHQHVKPICFVRQKKNGNVSPKTLDDIILINMEEFVILNTEQSTTKQNICISSPTITSTIPEDHNYFTPFVEKSPTAISKKNLENSKITNIDNINIDLDYFTENSEIIPADPLLTDNFEKSDVPKIITDIFENELYKCGAPSCTYSTNFLHDFKMHLHTCNTLNNTYLCGHCNAKFTSIINLCNHIETHGKNKFTCGTCEFKSSLEQVVKHMKDCHKVITTELNPVSLKKDNDKDRFVVEAIEKEIGKENQKSILKMHLGVTSSKEKDKVENVFDFKVIDVDKGLKKNEKMAEEIIDLTTSSHNEQMGDEAKEKTDKENDKIYPDFIPVIKRFICGVLNCNYLTHDDQTFRQHFAEMHANDTVYKCPHCQINILSLEIDKIVCHLKMHDLNLYKCPNCQFFHYQKRNIEEHICENHPNTDKYIVVIRELDDYTNGVSSSEDNIKETSLHQQTEIVLLQQENDSSDSDSEISKEDLNNSSSNLNCRYCDFVAKSTKNLHKHERCHSMNYSYNCNCCNYAQQLKSQNKNKITTETSSSRKRKLIENNLGETPAKILLENKQEYYGCQLCPKRSNDLDEIRSHFFKKHPKNTDHFKYKKIIVEKNKCNYCDWSSDAKSLKQHCLTAHNLQQTKTICAICCQIFHRPCSIKSHFNNMHSTKKISFYTSLEDGIILDKTEYMDEKQLIFMCSYCSDQFDNKTELFNHHYLLHSHLQFKETKKPKNIKSPNPEKKQYKCPNCGRTSNEYDSMKLHLINHFNFGCSHCNKTFSFLYNLKNHHQQHGDLPLIINKTSDYNKQTIDKILATMLFLNKDGTYSTKIDNILDEINDGTHSPENNLKRPHYGTDPDEPPTKILILHELEGTEGNVKKEITTVNNEEYSFYGTKPCDITNYKNVMSEIDIMGKIMRINVVAMSHILNLSPKVRLKDIKNQMKRI